MGEHAAVYGRPAVVAAIDRRLSAELERSPGDDGLRLVLPALGVDERLSWTELAGYAADLRDRWQAYTASPDPTRFAQVRGEDRAHVVKAALGEGVLAWGAPAFGATLRIESALPLGSGFGSSAACAVAVLDVLASAQGRPIDRDDLHRLSLEVERRQHGSPSGIDNATVLHGGLLWVDRYEGALRIESMAAPAAGAIFDHLRVYQTGEPAESTGAVVAAVRALRARDEDAFEQRLDAMTAATHAARAELQATSPSLERMLDLFRAFEAELEALGVVPPEVRELVRAIEASGGAAKISGAGGLAGPGAGSLLVLHPDPAALDAIPGLAARQALGIRLGGPGLRRDEAWLAVD